MVLLYNEFSRLLKYHPSGSFLKEHSLTLHLKFFVRIVELFFS